MRGARDFSHEQLGMETDSPRHWTRRQMLQWIVGLAKGSLVLFVGLGWVTRDRAAAQGYDQSVSPTPAEAPPPAMPSVAQAQATPTPTPSGTVQYSVTPVTPKPTVKPSPSGTANPGAQDRSNGGNAGKARGESNGGDAGKARGQSDGNGGAGKAQGQSDENDAGKAQGQSNSNGGCVVGVIFWGGTAVAILFELFHSIA
jgi:hypothetical protein